MAKKRYLILIGIIILAVLLSRFDVKKIILLLLNANIVFLLAALPLVFFAVALKALKWNAALRKTGVNISFSRAFRLYCVGFFLSIATPARLGDFAKALYLKKQAPFAKTVSTIFFDRVFDVLLLVITGIFGLGLFFSFFHSTLIPIEAMLGIVVLLVAGTAAFLKPHRIMPLIRPFFLAIIPKPYQKTISSNFHEFYGQTTRLFKESDLLALSTVLSLVATLLAVTVGFLLAQSLELDISWNFLLATIPLVALLDLLPISVLGVGTRDAALVYAFSFLSLPGETALSFSFLFLVFSYLSVSLVGLAFFLFEPISLQSSLFPAHPKAKAARKL